MPQTPFAFYVYIKFISMHLHILNCCRLIRFGHRICDIIGQFKCLLNGINAAIESN